MGIANFNVRKLNNDAIYVQYHQDGKAKEAAFPNWADFIVWIQEQVNSKPIAEPDKVVAEEKKKPVVMDKDMDLDPKPPHSKEN